MDYFIARLSLDFINGFTQVQLLVKSETQCPGCPYYNEFFYNINHYQLFKI